MAEQRIGMNKTGQSNFFLSIANGILVVTVRVELYDEAAEELQRHVLDRVYKQQLKGVLIDLSAVEIIDSFILRVFMDTVKMVKLLGAKTLITGIKPEVVASLVDFGNVSDEVRVALSADEALLRFNATTY